MSDRAAWPLGCQVMPWVQARGIDPRTPEDAHAYLPQVVRAIGAMGFAGYEAVLPLLPLHAPEPLLGAMADAGGLHLAAAHAAGPWWDPQAATRIPPLVEQACQLPTLGCTQLVVSLFPRPDGSPTADHIGCAVRLLGELGRACRESANIAVLFHNHPWEMADDAQFLTALVESCAPADVRLAPDLGWVAIGGMEPEAFIERYGPSIGYLHARGVTALGLDGHTVETGQGILDYVRIATALEQAGFDGWVVAESEYRPPWAGNTNPDASARLHWEGLQAALRPTTASSSS